MINYYLKIHLVCTRKRIRDRTFIDVEFEAFPKPNITWILQDQIGRRTFLQDEDYSRNYRSYNLRDDVRTKNY